MLTATIVSQSVCICVIITVRDHMLVSVFCSEYVVYVDIDGPMSLSGMAGGSVTLHTDVRGDLITWWTSGTLIAEIDRKAQIVSIRDDVLDGRFRHRLRLSGTGSLTITDIRSTDAGPYHLEISDSRHTLHKMFTVTVCGE